MRDRLKQLARNFTAALGIAALALAAAPLREAHSQGQAQTDILIQLENRLPNIAGYPPLAAPLASSSGDVAAATATATLTSAAAKTAYLTGIDITGTGATSGVGIACTVTGVLGGTLTFDFAVIAGATLSNAAAFRFPAPIPASAVNVNLVVSCPSFGTGNLHAAVTAYGFLTASAP